MRFKKSKKKFRRIKKRKMSKSSKRMRNLIKATIARLSEKTKLVNIWDLRTGFNQQQTFWRPLEPPIAQGSTPKYQIIKQTGTQFATADNSNYNTGSIVNAVMQGTQMRRLKMNIHMNIYPQLGYWTTTTLIPNPVVEQMDFAVSGDVFNVSAIARDLASKCLVRVAIIRGRKGISDGYVTSYLANEFQSQGNTVAVNQWPNILKPWNTKLVKCIYQKKFIINSTTLTKYKLNIRMPKKYAMRNLNFPTAQNDAGVPVAQNLYQGNDWLVIMYAPISYLTWTDPVPDQTFITYPVIYVNVSGTYLDI